MTVVSSVDYTLKKEAVLRDYRKGVVSRWDICDAHPEIGRIARNVGELTNTLCPVCSREKLRLLNFVYGDCLDSHNGRVLPFREVLNRSDHRFGEVSCHVVEVCIACQWNHLLRSIYISSEKKRAERRSS